MFKNKEGKVRSGWKIAGMLGTVFLFSIITAVIASIISIIYYTLHLTANGGINQNNLDQVLNSLYEDNSILDIILMPLQEVILIVIPIVAWKFVIKRPLSNMGLTAFHINRKEFLIGLLFGMISISIVFFLALLSGTVTVTDWTPHFNFKQLAFLPFFISVGFAEEILTRGYVMTVLRQTRNIYIAVIGSSVIFAAMHGLNSGIGLIPLINLTLVGILLAYMYIKSGNLWMCIGYHITWNYFQGCVFGLPVSGMESVGIVTSRNIGNNIWNGGIFGPEGGLFVTMVVLLGFLFVKQNFNHSKFDFMATE